MMESNRPKKKLVEPLTKVQKVKKLIDKYGDFAVFVGLMAGFWGSFAFVAYTVITLSNFWIFAIALVTTAAFGFYIWGRDFSAGLVLVLGLSFLTFILTTKIADSEVSFVERTSQREISELTFIDNNKVLTYRDELSGEMMAETLVEADFYRLKSDFLSGKEECSLISELYRHDFTKYEKTKSGFECH